MQNDFHLLGACAIQGASVHVRNRLDRRAAHACRQRKTTLDHCGKRGGKDNVDLFVCPCHYPVLPSFTYSEPPTVSRRMKKRVDREVDPLH